MWEKMGERACCSWRGGEGGMKVCEWLGEDAYGDWCMLWSVVIVYDCGLLKVLIAIDECCCAGMRVLVAF